jgi:hypothetical protein
VGESSLVVNDILTVTFNNNGSFTATIQSPSEAIATDAGNWVVSPAVTPSPFANPQAHLVLTGTNGVVLLSGDVLLIKLDQMVMLSATESVTSTTIVTELVLTKLTP